LKRTKAPQDELNTLPGDVGFDPTMHSYDSSEMTSPSAVQTRREHPHELDTSENTAIEGADAETVDGVQQRIHNAVEASRRARVKHDAFVGTNILGRFQVQSKIGEGGMGAVYRAVQTSMDRPVAIKILLRNLVKDDRFVQRFQNEALAVSRLAHPNTVRVIDFGQVDDATLFIAMELLDGQPLQRVMRRHGALPARRTMRVLTQVCRSLAEAHSKGIIHRDLKPDNLFISDVDDSHDFVKVLDFGVAKLVDDKSAGSLTQTHMLLGTPKYMAPEQAMSRGVDARSDLYSLGVIAYEMLTGASPFRGEAMAVLYKQVNEPPPPMREIASDVVVPPELEQFVYRMLEKDPDLRPQSASEVASALEAMLERIPHQFEQVLLRSNPEVTAVLNQLGGDMATSVSLHELPIPQEEEPPARRAWGLWIGLGLLVAAGLGSTALVIQLEGTAPSALPMSEAPQFAGSAPYAGLALAAPRPAVRVKVTSDPGGASVYRGDQLVGVAPVTLEQWKDAPADSFRVVFDGGGERPLQVTYDADGNYSVSMEREPSRTAPEPEVAAPAQQDGTTAKRPLRPARKPVEVAAPSVEPEPTKPADDGRVDAARPAGTGRVNVLK
jgi:serine/threonine-protein kinase